MDEITLKWNPIGQHCSLVRLYLPLYGSWRWSEEKQMWANDRVKYPKVLEKQQRKLRSLQEAILLWEFPQPAHNPSQKISWNSPRLYGHPIANAVVPGCDDVQSFPGNNPL